MRDGQAFGGLHQRQHELALHQTGLGHAVGAHIIFEVRLTRDRHRGEVIKHDREVLINQGAHEQAQALTEFVAVRINHVHGTQQVLMFKRPFRHMLRRTPRARWQGNGLQPAQHAEFAAWLAQAVHDHQAQAAQYIDLGFGASPGQRQVIKPQGSPEFRQGPDVARMAAVCKAQSIQGRRSTAH